MSRGISPFTRTLPTVRISGRTRTDTDEVVVRESAATIMVNNRELVTLLCSPVDLDCLAIGFLLSEGFLTARQQIEKLRIDERQGIVSVQTQEDKDMKTDVIHKRIITSGGGKGSSFGTGFVPLDTTVESHIEFSTSDILHLVDEFQHYSEVYRSTHGVHSAALCDGKQILVFKEDIGRHNAIDKMFGECLLTDIATEDKMVIISGRVSSEMLLKLAKRTVPIVISVAVPTDKGVELATAMNMTLVGRVRGGRMNIYSGAWRIKP